MTALTVNLNPVIRLTDEQFYQLCQLNRDLKFERTAKGELIIMPPTGGETGNRNGRLTQQLFNWSDGNSLGIAFDSSTDFVVELLSPSDSLQAAQEKMQEYRNNGTCLGWLINRRAKQVEIYRPDREIELLQSQEKQFCPNSSSSCN